MNCRKCIGPMSREIYLMMNIYGICSKWIGKDQKIMLKIVGQLKGVCMKTLVLVFHPHLEKSQVNRKLMDAANETGDVTVVDEYAAYPDFRIKGMLFRNGKSRMPTSRQQLSVRRKEL